MKDERPKLKPVYLKDDFKPIAENFFKSFVVVMALVGFFIYLLITQ